MLGRQPLFQISTGRSLRYILKCSFITRVHGNPWVMQNYGRCHTLWLPKNLMVHSISWKWQGQPQKWMNRYSRSKTGMVRQYLLYTMREKGYMLMTEKRELKEFSPPEASER